MHKSVTVIGAGIVGISCALELQRRGYTVELLDRRGIAEETSMGNAGLLSYSNITPLADPALLPRLPRMLLNIDADFRLHYPHFLSLLPWMSRFLVRCRRSTFLADGAAMAAITLPSIEMHREWIAQAGVQDLLNQGGALKVYRHAQTMRREDLECELFDRCGVRHTRLEPDEVYELEPDLKRIFEGGRLIDDTLSLRNPQKLCQAYAQLFSAAGGVFRRAEVRRLRPHADAWELTTEQGTSRVERVVVCLGAWTPDLIGALGYSNPLAIERGYHAVFNAQAGCRLSRPMYDVDASYVIAPMEAGLRVTTGSNLVRHETRPDPAQLARVTPWVREAFPLEAQVTGEPWMGRRPTVPDTLPIIGCAPGQQNLWLAFAHSHMGLTMGPMTGRLIANDIDGRPQPIAMDPYRPGRYL